MKKTIAVLLSALLLFGVLAGCGAKKEEPTPTPTPVPTEAPKPDFVFKTYDIVNNREISNQAYVMGTLITEPKLFTTKRGIQITQYALESIPALGQDFFTMSYE